MMPLKFLWPKNSSARDSRPIPEHQRVGRVDEVLDMSSSDARAAQDLAADEAVGWRGTRLESRHAAPGDQSTNFRCIITQSDLEACVQGSLVSRYCAGDLLTSLLTSHLARATT
jgi:hypothetical protein